MKQVINIAIFGLSLDVANELKTQIQQFISSSQSINWVNIASPDLELLLVNESFFSTHTIQNILKNKQCKFLRLVRNSSLSGKISEEILYYPFLKSYDLAVYFNQNFGSNLSTNHTEDKNKVIERSTDFRHTINELFNHRNGFVKVFDDNGEIGIVDTRTERIWLKHQRKYLSITPSFSHTYAKSSEAMAMKDEDVKDLKIWLWQIVFNSNIYNSNNFIKDNDCFKLNLWPQFKDDYGRKELLKIAACFSLGAKIQDIIEQLNIQRSKLDKFIYVAQLLKMIQKIDPEEVKFIVKQTQNESQDSGIFRGFLGKLRKKIGI